MGTGFFGKMPSAGDFVARGLPAGLRAPLDHWLTSEIMPIVRNAKVWPEGGVRAVAVLNEASWLLVIEPSEDAVGRIYPLVACSPLCGAAQAEADVWADAAWAALLQATDAQAGADALADLLAPVKAPRESAPELQPDVMWWGRATPERVELMLPKLARLARASSD
ncbi:type VI secretion system-associated protein TagF [Lentibacter algarum]|uniref:type VI secretion system-associated protein TagF n=1 Tax=Lentibacter algarum TaxID=576131 RepID=UPI001C0685C4|nr:type VI secretion system-associated protein TagF [Lentibacter algarum]MBU2980573.1 type VI secretion system-associated protein TagF [Lentibacter algarum]